MSTLHIILYLKSDIIISLKLKFLTEASYHKISNLQVEILKSRVSSPLVVNSSDPLLKDILSSFDFDIIKKDQKLPSNVFENYERIKRVESEGQYSVTGDTYIIWIKDTGIVVRIELFGEVVERLSIVDNLSLRKVKDITVLYLVKNILKIKHNSADIPEEVRQYFQDEYFLEYEPDIEPKSVLNFYINKSLSIKDKYFSLPIYVNKESLWEMDLIRFAKEDYRMDYHGLYIEEFKLKLDETFKQAINYSVIDKGTVKKFLSKNITYHEDKNADKGFYSNEEQHVVVTDLEIFGNLFFKSTIQNKSVSNLFNGEIKAGDYIVHDLHGVGIYRGIISQEVGEEVKDYIKIEYADNDTLYVPYDTVDKVSKFIGEGSNPHLTRLGSAEWDTIRAKAQKNVEDIADELLDLYARRELEKGFAYDVKKARELLDNLTSEFGYEDTVDQKRTTIEVLEDMEAEKPMDRLLVGDVGFGKTEIAIRAAYLAVLNNKQVLVLAPTTILVSQLYKVFSERLAKHGVKLHKVSRFEGTAVNKKNIEDINDGKIDVLIGTHRLLSSDVSPKNLGLLIIDEEQRFGVKQKEKIKNFKANIDVLSMSATPIPRTLQMSLSGIRDISIISTPPSGRRSVSTHLIEKSQMYEPIRAEIERNGQVFIVHNNISTIETLARKIQEKIPNARIGIGHAKMSGQKLERLMLEFLERKFDVLIATTIIENGIDIPSVNTMVIDDANMFGLSQLHQLRGRVGRSDTQAYCYLTVPYTLTDGKINQKELDKELEREFADEEDIKTIEKKKEMSHVAVDRIKAILEYQSLGSGFHIASKDLEIRGGGSILSSSQSGHINTIGYDLYLRMLYQEINKRRKTYY